MRPDEREMMKGCGLKNAHPMVGFLYFLIVFVFSLSVRHPLPAVLSLAAALSYNVYLRGKRALRAILFFVFPMLVAVPLVNALFSHYGVTVLFVLRSGNSFTLEALVYGFFLAVRFATVLLWLDCFNEIIDADRFIALFGRFSPKTALVISMTLRFIPMLREGYADIETARKGIGFSSADKSLMKRLKNSAHTLSILITWVLESAIDTAYSMKARGYGLKGRTSYSRYVFTFSDGVVTVCQVLLSAASCVCIFSLRAMYNPVIDIEKPGWLAGMSIVFFLMLCLWPFALEMREKQLVKSRKGSPVGIEE